MDKVIRIAIDRYAPNKEEIWEDPPEWTQTEEHQAQIREKFMPVHSMLIPQIPTVFSVLTETSKRFVVNSTEEIRNVVGKKMSRNTKMYQTVFMRITLDYFRKDPHGGQVVIDEYFKEHWDILKTNTFPYNPKTGKRLMWNRSLAIQADQNVYLVTDDADERWVLKWEGDGSTQEMLEERHYTNIDRLGGVTPRRIKGFYVLGISVLVLEYLEALDITDNPLEVGRQLIATQLKYIHVFGLHNDLKPDNIRKRRGDPPVYFIIDMDLDTSLMPGGTFKRNHWTPFYQSQPMFPFKFSYGSYRADLIELGSVMNQMVAARNYRLKMGPYKENYGLKHRKAAIGLLEDDLFADIETMRDYYFSPDRTEPIPWHVARAMTRIAKSIDGVYKGENGVTHDYWRYVLALPERDMPTNVHDSIAMNILTYSFSANEYMKETMEAMVKQGLECIECNANIAKNKCIDCWKETYLCENNTCVSTHICSNKKIN